MALNIKQKPFKSVILSDKFNKSILISEGDYIELRDIKNNVIKGEITKMTGQKNINFLIKPKDSKEYSYTQLIPLDSIDEILSKSANKK